jgi:hypothetical protein
VSLQEIQNISAPDGAAAGTVPVATGAEAATTQSQSIVANSTQPAKIAGDITHYGFVTFDPGRKHLARIVAVKGEKVNVRRFDKKTGEWRTKNETREREACIPLSAEEAESSFPGCVAAWGKAGQSPTEGGGKVSRHLSPNLAPSVVAAPAFQSVADFLSAYSDKKKTIDELTDKFVEKVGEAKQAQDDILPHLSYMQSLLSKKGTNHHLVVAARKRGHQIPWWTDYYESYKDKLWESLRTMERRIAAYRNDPTAPVSKADRDPIPHLNKAARRTLIEGNHRAVEIMAAFEAGRDATKEIAECKAMMNGKRLDDIMQAHEKEPDYRGILSKVLQTVADMEPSLPAAFVKAVCELAKACRFKIALTPVPAQKRGGKVNVHLRSSRSTKGTTAKPMQIAPIQQKPPDDVPLQSDKKYTVRPHPQGGFGVYEPGSTVCLQRHPSQDGAWDAIDAINAGTTAADLGAAEHANAIAG